MKDSYLVQKSVRLPQELVDFVQSQSGNDFSKKLVKILKDYKDGYTLRIAQVQRYDELIDNRQKQLQELTEKVNSLSFIIDHLSSISGVPEKL